MRKWILVYAHLSTQQRKFVDEEAKKLYNDKPELYNAFLNIFRIKILKKYLYTPSLEIQLVEHDKNHEHIINLVLEDRKLIQPLIPGKLNFSFKKLEDSLGLPIRDSPHSLNNILELIKSLKTDVKAVVIGGGVAGLAASNYLFKHNISAILLEAGEIGGRLRCCKNGIPIGANYLHCIQGRTFDPRIKRGDKSLLGLANILKPKVADTCGGCWESTLYCNWYDYNGDLIPLERVVWMHHLFQLTLDTASDLKESLDMSSYPKTSKLEQEKYFNFSRKSLSKLYNELVPAFPLKCSPSLGIPRRATQSDISTDDESHSSNGSYEKLYETSYTLFDLIKHAFNYIIITRHISQQDLTLRDFCLFWSIIRTRLGHNSPLDDTSVLMCRGKTKMQASHEFGTLRGAVKDSRLISRTYNAQNKVKIEEFSLKTTSEKVMVEGWSWLINYLSSPILNRIRTNAKVKAIDINDGVVHIKFLLDGEELIISSEYCIVAVPLGGLRNISFNPPLTAKKRALSNVSMGFHNKLIMEFNEEDIFWPRDIVQFNCLDDKFQFMNLDAYGHKGLLLSHLFPPFSIDFHGWTDNEVLDECLKVLSLMFKCNVKRPKYYHLTRWSDDVNTNGSYSYPKAGALSDDIFILRSPHPPEGPRILFAGEYLSNSYYQCVDGAYDTGIRAAEEIVAKYNLMEIGLLDKCIRENIKVGRPSKDRPVSSKSFLDEYVGYYLTDGEEEDEKIEKLNRDPQINEMCKDRIRWEIESYSNPFGNNRITRKRCKCCTYAGASYEVIESMQNGTIYTNIIMDLKATNKDNLNNLRQENFILNRFENKREITKRMKTLTKKMEKAKKRHKKLAKYLSIA